MTMGTPITMKKVFQTYPLNTGYTGSNIDFTRNPNLKNNRKGFIETLPGLKKGYMINVALFAALKEIPSENPKSLPQHTMVIFGLLFNVFFVFGFELAFLKCQIY